MIINERREQPSQASIFLAFCICLAISLGSVATHNPTFEETSFFIGIVRAIVAMLLIGLHLLFISSERLTYFIPLPINFTTHRIAIFGCFVSFLVSATFLMLRLNELEPDQLNLDSSTLWLATTFFIILFVVQIMIQRPGYPSTILLMSIGGFLFLNYFHINAISLESDTRQPFSLYYEAIDRFFIGLDPYQVYDSAGSRPFTVLPGHWLSYVLFRFLNLDPRWLGSLAQLASVCLIYTAIPKKRKHITAYLLSLYLLSPYQISVEASYTGILPLVISLIFFLFCRGYYLLGVAALGWSVSLSLYSCLLVPFALGFLLKKQPFKYWIIYLALGILFGTMQLLPFGMRFQDTFLYCTVSYWLDTFFWNGFNISYWLVPIIGGYGLYFLQIFFFLVLFVQYLKSDMSLSTSLVYASTYSLFFLITNRVVENYLFPLIFLQALMGFVVFDESKSAKATIKIHRPTAEGQKPEYK